MAIRAYLLLSLVHIETEKAAQSLRERPGVVVADCLEGCSDIMVMFEAPKREELARSLMPVLGSLDHSIEDLRLLVTQDKVSPAIIAQNKH